MFSFNNGKSKHAATWVKMKQVLHPPYVPFCHVVCFNILIDRLLCLIIHMGSKVLNALSGPGTRPKLKFVLFLWGAI